MLALTHPGPPTVPRILTALASATVTCKVLTPGALLIEELFSVLADQGLGNGIAELSGGTLASVSYCVPAEGRAGKEVSYSETRNLDHGQLVLGAATLGSRNGKPFMHSHCAWINAAGEVQAGHLWPETKIGNFGPIAVVQGLPGVELINADDPETRMPVFTPHLSKDPDMRNAPNTASSVGRTIIARICPNEDITAAVKEICVEYGIHNAILRGGIGSLIGASFSDYEGRPTRRVDGPGTEIVTLVGHAREGHSNGDGANSATLDVEMSCTLVDKHGDVHAGRLVPGENPVAVTYELCLQEIEPIYCSRPSAAVKTGTNYSATC